MHLKHPLFLFDIGLRTKFFIFIFSCLLFATIGASAKSVVVVQRLDYAIANSFQKGDTLFVMMDGAIADSIIKKGESKKEKNKKKFVAALFAFPFPFGFMGGHRIMLGTKPWVPIVYVATFGGCFGVLPLIDFFVILCSKDIEEYENNPNIFMWLK